MILPAVSFFVTWSFSRMRLSLRLPRTFPGILEMANTVLTEITTDGVLASPQSLCRSQILANLPSLPEAFHRRDQYDYDDMMQEFVASVPRRVTREVVTTSQPIRHGESVAVRENVSARNAAEIRPKVQSAPTSLSRRGPMVSTPTVLQIERAPRMAPRQSEFRSAHLVGVCGSGMKALAEYLTDVGCQVTGSDLQSPAMTLALMEARGLRIHQGHHGRFLPPDVDVLVYSPAVGPENPERRWAQRLGIPQMSYTEILGHLMRDHVGISVAGTHGKSTTTAMLATILGDARLSPSAVVGAELIQRNASGWAGHGPHFVVESCEYQRSFLKLSPHSAVILGIEEDHFDCYADLTETQTAFSEFAALLPGDGLLLVRSDCPISLSVARSTAASVETFSLSSRSDWWATDVRPVDGGSRFRIFRRGQFFAEATLAIPGKHNVLNALAATALAHHAGASVTDIRESLNGFQGIRRRFEAVGSWRGITLVDDYAHHPTSVRVTLETARQRFGQRRIWSVFQPHQLSRTRRLMKEFSESFSQADEVLFVPVYAARENGDEEAVELACELANRVSESGQRARFVPSLDQAVATLEDETLPGDVLIAMGAGDITRVPHEFTRRLQRHHATRRSVGFSDLAQGRWVG